MEIKSIDFTKYNYILVGTIEGLIYLKNSSGSINSYRVGDVIQGYGEIHNIYDDGSVLTSKGNFDFKKTTK